LFVLGGVNAEGGALADAWTWRSGIGWSSIALPADRSPRNVKAAVFSHRDWRVWAVDDRAEGRRLLRIDAATGEVTTIVSVPELNDLTALWLFTMEDGRVLVAGNFGSSYRVALFAVQPFDQGASVTVSGRYEAPGKLATAPGVRHSSISLGLENVVPGTVAFVVAPTTITINDLR